MKAKKLFAGLLAAVMTVSTIFMSGCSSSNSEENSANTTSTRKIMTLNMYIMTGQETDPEVAKQVQMQINQILLPEYKTMLKINYVTEDNYWDTIEAVKEQVSHYREFGEVLDEEDKAKADKEQTEETDSADGAEIPAEEEGVLESDGAVKGTDDMTFNELIDFIFDSEDISLTKPQLDIFVVDDYDKYLELVSNDELAPMNEYLSYDSKALTKYIYPTFLSAASVGKNTYGIPTNYALDNEFTYFVYNKNLLNKYGYSASDLTNYSSLDEYLSLIKNNEPGVWPISGACELAGAEVYEDSFLAVARQFNTVGTNILPTFMEQRYINHLKAVKNYANKGYYPSQPVQNARYAIEIVKSSELLEHEWTENGTTYETYLYDVHRVSGDEAFKSAMCISSLSTYKARAMEIITLFNTNAELANLLQYGISGTNYYYDTETGSVTMLNDSYTMNTYHTGNTYIKYPLAGNEDYVEKAKVSNMQTAPSAFLGFNPVFDDIEDKSTYEAVKAICKAAQKAIDDGTMDIDTAVSYARRELVALGCVYVDTENLGGIFGKMVKAQKTQAELTTASFTLSDDVVHYNDYLGLELEEIVKPEPETAEETGSEGETDETGTVDGDNGENSETAENAEENADVQ